MDVPRCFTSIRYRYPVVSMSNEPNARLTATARARKYIRLRFVTYEAPSEAFTPALFPVAHNGREMHKYLLYCRDLCYNIIVINK